MKGIVFDIDDTLYCRQVMLIKAAEMVLGIDIPNWQEFMRIYYEKSDVNMSMLESGEVSTHDINGWRYNETFRILGLPYKQEDGGKAADTYLELQSHMFVSDDMKSVLDALSADPQIRIGILTAGESQHQWNKVDMLGLDRWFDGYFCAEDYGFIPKEEIFPFVKEAFPDSRYVMIGDRDSDFRVGQVNGLFTVGCAYGFGTEEERRVCDRVIAAPEELPAVLDSLPA